MRNVCLVVAALLRSPGVKPKSVVAKTSESTSLWVEVNWPEQQWVALWCLGNEQDHTGFM